MGIEDLPIVKECFGPLTVVEITEINWRNKIGVYYIVGKLNDETLVAATEISFSGKKRIINDYKYYFLEKF